MRKEKKLKEIRRGGIWAVVRRDDLGNEIKSELVRVGAVRRNWETGQFMVVLNHRLGLGGAVSDNMLLEERVKVVEGEIVRREYRSVVDERVEMRPPTPEEQEELKRGNKIAWSFERDR